MNNEDFFPWGVSVFVWTKNSCHDFTSCRQIVINLSCFFLYRYTCVMTMIQGAN